MARIPKTRFTVRNRVSVINIIQHLQDNLPVGDLECWMIEEIACLTDPRLVKLQKVIVDGWQHEFMRLCPEHMDEAFSAVLSEISLVANVQVA